MDPNFDRALENSSVSEDARPAPESDLSEAPFERWIRLADLLLGDLPLLAAKGSPRAQSLASFHKY
jgi:hypothetical protein